MRILLIAFFIGCFTTSSLCAEPSLYEELGGKKAIDRIVDNTIQLSHSAPQISFHFENIDEGNLREQLTQQLCALSGGPCQYEGLDMEEAHAGMEITKAEFDYFVSLFIKALEKSNIAFTAQNKLIARLAPLRPEIIEQ
jgi:hemoglobin